MPWVSAAVIGHYLSETDFMLLLWVSTWVRVSATLIGHYALFEAEFIL
jgi:hypothetical protein